jgi:hypothetical protein
MPADARHLFDVLEVRARLSRRLPPTCVRSTSKVFPVQSVIEQRISATGASDKGSGI